MMSSSAVLPVGFRFRPTDEELIQHYLKAKISGRAHPDLFVIPDVDLATCEPWNLPARSVIKSDDPEWFFFASREPPKYPGRHRSNRSTAAGYWKATGKDRLIRSNNALIGIKKTLVFHRGRAPRGRRTAWIMHEYRTTEPQFETGRKGSFVLYRLFDKHEDETSSESPSTSSPGNPPDEARNQTATKIATDDAGHLLVAVDDKGQEDSFLDVLAELPDLQPGQRYDGFPNITSPMRPYTDHPFVGNMGEQAYFDSIIADQDLQDLLFNPTCDETDRHLSGNADDLLFNPTCAETDRHLSGNAESNPIVAAATSTNNSNSNALLLLDSSCRKGDVDQMLLTQRADFTDAAPSSSGINTLQTDRCDDNHETRAHANMAYRGADHLYQLTPVFDPQMEPQNSGAFCSWPPYPQRSSNTLVDPSRSDMINSNAFDEQEGWVEAHSTQQFTVPEFIDPQQGTAARRVRLVYAVQRASASQPILASDLESEDEAGSCCSTGSSSNNEDFVNAASRTMGIGHPATEVVSSMVVTDKLQHLSSSEDIYTKLPGGANLKQRLKQGSAQSTPNASEGLLQQQQSNHVLGDASPAEQHEPFGSVVRLLCLALLVLVLLSVWEKVAKLMSCTNDSRL